MACARTVPVVVPSPATSEVLLATSRTSCAPMFSYGSWSSISLATVTPSLVMVGDPYFFSSTTFRPRGPSVTFTAFATASTPRCNARRASSLNNNCLAMSSSSLTDHRKDVFLADDHEFLPVNLDLVAGVFSKDDFVALLHFLGRALAVVQ